MKSKGHIQSFNEHAEENKNINDHTGYDEDGHSLNYQGNILPIKKDHKQENLNISDVSKEQLKHFLDYVRRYHVSTIPMDMIDEYVDSYISNEID